MATNALSLENINAYYGDSHVLGDVSFELGEARMLGLLGRNGAGKSTCMNVAMGLLPPRRGEVRVFGKPVGGLSPELIAASGVALEFAERITLLHFGEVIVEGNRAEVVNNPRTREVYLGH